jgi:hypothetical protein
MARDHFIAPTAPTDEAVAVRLGAGSGAANNLTTAEVGKFVKLVAESRYNLAAAGNEIEGVIFSVELAPQNGFTVGGVVEEGILNVTFDGLQATPGTGVVAIGDYVVCGTPVAKDTALTGYPKVCKATGAVTTLTFKWRVVSLGTAGTGAVGTTGVISYVG